MKELSSSALVDRLAATPTRLTRAVEGWSDAEWRAAPETGGWSAAEIVAHLRASDDIIGYRVYAILARDDPPMPAYDERRWAEVMCYAEAEARTTLTVFAQRRAELVAALRRASDEAWERVGTHEVRGRQRLSDVVRLLVDHEEEHCAQIEALARARSASHPTA